MSQEKQTREKTKDKSALVECLRKLSAAVKDLAALLEAQDSPAPAEETPVKEVPAPAKEYTYEETRAILAEKSRTGFRAEVKAILTAHGVKQLSDVKDPKVLAEIVAEAEGIGNG